GCPMREPVFAQLGILVLGARANATASGCERLGVRIVTIETSPEFNAARIVIDHEQCFILLRSTLLPLAFGPIEALANRQIGQRVPLTTSSRLPPRRGITDEALRGRKGHNGVKES